MVKFVKDLSADVVEVWRDSWLRWTLFIGLIGAYGLFVVQPSMGCDFSAYKENQLFVALTYFFMHRWAHCFLSAPFFDTFLPFWNNFFGVLALGCATILWTIALKRQLNGSISREEQLVFVALFISSPITVIQSLGPHAMPSHFVALASDALAVLLWQRNPGWKRLIVSAICLAFGTAISQCHMATFLVAMFGLTAISADRDNRFDWRPIWSGLCVLVLGVIIWAAIAFLPLLIVKAFGVVIPPSGGAHDQILWITSGRPFMENLKLMLLSGLWRWGYMAFFCVGLRVVLCCFLFIGVVAIACFCRRQWWRGVLFLMTGAACFVFPVMQGTFALTRICVWFVVFVALVGVMAVRSVQNTRPKYVVAAICLLVAFFQARETATAYYANWRRSNMDRAAMQVLATDLQRKYGTKIPLPVVMIGGIETWPTLLEDQRPFRFLPLDRHPLMLHSDFTSQNVAREFYNITREQVGLVLPLPDLTVYDRVRSIWYTKIAQLPAWPQDGYIFEDGEGHIIVNLGRQENRFNRYDVKNYSSPNEQLIQRKLCLGWGDAMLVRIWAPLYEWIQAHPEA